jgi:VWFA-related protein
LQKLSTPERQKRVALSMLLKIALLSFFALLPASLSAQSGRRKPAAPATVTPAPRSRPVPDAAAQRPRRANATTESVDAATAGASAPQTSQPATSSSSQTVTPVASTARGDAEAEQAEVIRINSNLVTIPASVVDAAGKPVIDLRLEDFELRVDGVTKPISDLGRAETPVRMAMLFDNSDSLREARELEKQAAMRFFRVVMRPVDQAAIYSVATEDVLEQPLTNDVQKLVHTIERFGKPEGATALFDAIVEAAAYLRPQQGRKVIVIVSDGVENLSKIEDFDEVLRRALAADCQIYVVQTGHIENANLRDLVAERRMEQFAAQTGGAVYVPKVTSDLDAAFAQIAADLAQQYILSYYPNDDARDGRYKVITLRVPARPTWRVRARKGYYTPKG